MLSQIDFLLRNATEQIYEPNVILTQIVKRVWHSSKKKNARSKAHRECQNKAINPLKNRKKGKVQSQRKRDEEKFCFQQICFNFRTWHNSRGNSQFVFML